jgi:hypothetical protein
MDLIILSSLAESKLTDLSFLRRVRVMITPAIITPIFLASAIRERSLLRDARAEKARMAKSMKA